MKPSNKNFWITLQVASSNTKSPYTNPKNTASKKLPFRFEFAITPAGALVAGAIGYQAAMAITAKTAYVSALGDLITQLYQAGATIVSQPVVAVENQQTLQASAVAKAVTNASDNLKMLPVVKWHLIRKVVSVSQANSGSTSTSTKQAAAGTPDSAATANGTFESVQAVSVTYALW